jgi:hypothetical protein
LTVDGVRVRRSTSWMLVGDRWWRRGRRDTGGFGDRSWAGPHSMASRCVAVQRMACVQRLRHACVSRRRGKRLSCCDGFALDTA